MRRHHPSRPIPLRLRLRIRGGARRLGEIGRMTLAPQNPNQTLWGPVDPHPRQPMSPWGKAILCLAALFLVAVFIGVVANWPTTQDAKCDQYKRAATFGSDQFERQAGAQLYARDCR